MLAEQSDTLSGARVLVADDSAINRELIQQMLQGFGCDAVAVHDGDEVLIYLQDHAVDMLILDCAMPGQNGFSVARAVRAWEQARNQPPMPIVAVTAFVQADTREQCLAAGMNQYLAKPVLPDALRVALEGALAERGGEPFGQTVMSTTVREAMQRQLGDYYPTFMTNFIRYARDQLTKIERAGNDQDWVELRKKAHQFKGESGQIGAEEVVKACLALEAWAAESPETHSFSRITRDLTRQVDALEQYVASETEAK